MVNHILISSYTDEITTLTFDPSTLSLHVASSATVGHNPSWITSYPGDRSLVFASLEQPEGKVVVLKYDQVGKPTIVAQASSGGADPCSLFATKDELLIANYSDGVLATFPISPSPPYLLSSSPTTTKFSGFGPNRSRQASSHPHQVILHGEYEELLVPDLGSDIVRRFKKADDGSWRYQGHIQYEAGSGPRHVAFHEGDLYTLLELTSSLVKHHFPPLPNLPTFVTSTPTMSQPPPNPNDMLAAEILIPPTNKAYPIPYVYISNRNDPSPEGDTIAIFTIANSEKLDLVAEVRTGLKHIRGMLFCGAEDKWLIIGGVNGGGVKVFERIDGGKGLKMIAENPNVQAPTGFLWM